MGGTFDLFDGDCDGQNRSHSQFSRQRNVCDGVAWCERAFIRSGSATFSKYPLNELFNICDCSRLGNYFLGNPV